MYSHGIHIETLMVRCGPVKHHVFFSRYDTGMYFYKRFKSIREVIMDRGDQVTGSGLGV